MSQWKWLCSTPIKYGAITWVWTILMVGHHKEMTTQINFQYESIRLLDILYSKSIVKYLSNFQEWEKKLREALMEVPIKFYEEGYIENWT